MSRDAVALVWLRSDLRLDDHPALAAAGAEAPRRVLLYCVDPRHGGTGAFGFRRLGAHRARFLVQSLADLREACRARGGELVVRRGRPEDVVPALARAVGATSVHWHEEVGTEERRVERALAQALAAQGIAARPAWGHTLLAPSELPFPVAEVPEVFTRFRERVERYARVPAPLDPPAALPGPALDPGPLPELADWGLVDPPDDPRALFRPRGGARAAHERLDEYLWRGDHLRRYKDTRDGMLRVDDSSKLSPWLAVGALSPRRIWAEVQRYEAERVRNDSTYWLGFELRWRDYFRFVMARWGSRLFAQDGIRRRRIAWRDPAQGAAREDLLRWCRGDTGEPLVDAAMRELAATGFTSNRARQNVASHLVRRLEVDWRAGAEWFEAQLVDYDVASNWGNWCYLAGVGNDPRGVRTFDPRAQAQRYDPDGAFVRHWLGAPPAG